MLVCDTSRACTAQTRANSSSTSNDSSCNSRPSDGSNKLLLSFQQRVSMLEQDAATARSQLLQAEQQVEQQKQTNAVLQQQLTALQQQLVQAQQLLLDLPKQLGSSSSSTLTMCTWLYAAAFRACKSYCSFSQSFSIRSNKLKQVKRTIPTAISHTSSYT